MEVKEPVIKFKNVCFSYQKREVLHNVNFETNPTDMMAIVGPNGGGKTTLVKMMLGLLKPTHGEVQLFGQSPEASRDNVGYVPQNIVFDPKFPVTTQEVVKMGLVNSSYSKPQKHEQILTALHQTGCDHLLKKPFSSLSGGERQRVIIAQSLVSNPSLLILDEPTANVDPKSEHELYQLFSDLNKEIPIVFVSHNLTVVSNHVSHVLCVNHTTDLHPISEILQSTFTELYGGELAVISHGKSCHITDPSHAMNTPHKGQENCCKH